MHKKVLATSAFLIGVSIIEKIGSFLVIPILTRYLTPDSYGSLITAMAYTGILSLFFYCGLNSSLARWYTTWNENWDKKLYEKYIFVIISSLAILIGLVMMGINSLYPLSQLIGTDFKLFMAVYISSLLLIPFNIKTTVWTIENKAFLTLIGGFIKTISLVALILFFIPKFQSPYIKPYAEIISLLLFFLFFVKSYFSSAYPKFSTSNCSSIKNVLKESFNYGFSIQLSQLLFWIIASSDRIILSKLLGNSAVGFYSILMFSIMPVFLIVSFNNAFSISYLKFMNENNDIKKACSYISNYLLYGGIIIFIYKLILYFFSKNIILLISTKEYLKVSNSLHLGAEILFFYLAYLLFSRNLHFYKNNKAIVTIMLISSIINVVANLILIPLFGIIGSLYGSMLAYFIMATISMIYLYKDAKFTNIKLLMLIFILFSSIFLIFDVFILNHL